jgi:hypothetical protein
MSLQPTSTNACAVILNALIEGLCTALDRCYDFKNIFGIKIGERIGVFDSKQSYNFLQKMDHNICFKEKCHFPDKN